MIISSQGAHTAITGGGERHNNKMPLSHHGLGAFVILWALFPYRDFLPVLEGKYHFVVVDRDLAEQSADVAFVICDHRSGKALEE